MEEHKNLCSSLTGLKGGVGETVRVGTQLPQRKTRCKDSDELMHSRVQYIKSLVLQTHSKQQLVLTEEGQHANDTLTESTPVKRKHSRPPRFDNL